MKAPRTIAKTAGNSAKDGQIASNSSRSASTPVWPGLPTSEQRSHALEIEEILPSQILLIHGFFPAKACASWTSYLSNPANIPLQATPPAKKGEAARTNHRFSKTDQALADRLWHETGLQDVVLAPENAQMFTSSEKAGSKLIGLNPNIRIYRYEPGQSFAPHYDATVKVGPNQTEWTLLIYLSGSLDGVEGGETAFYPCGVAPAEASGARKRKIRPGEEDVVVELERGLALLHRHGRECLLHEGRPVRKGVKWILRSDVVLG